MPPRCAPRSSTSEVVIAALENAAAFQATLLASDHLCHFGPIHLVIDTSTVHPRDSRNARTLLARRGARYLDAPVSGGTLGAERGTLTILVGGQADDFERARPVLAVLATAHLLGPAGAGHTAKLVNQAIVAITIGAAAEGLFLAERAGLDGQQPLRALEGGFADGRILREHGQRILLRNFVPGAANRIFLKDLDAVQSLADDLSTALPLASRSRQAYANLLAAGHAESDHSSYFRYLELINDRAAAQPAFDGGPG